MTMQLTNAQSKTLAGFCNDIAKGLLLSAAANHIVPSAASLEAKVIFSLIGVALTVVFLGFALFFSHE